MVDFGTCLKCGSRAVVCKCMLEKDAGHLDRALMPKAMLNAYEPRTAFIAHKMRQAGWHNDVAALNVLFMASGFNSAEIGEFFKQGRQQREDGLPCSCKACCNSRRAAREMGAGI